MARGKYSNKKKNQVHQEESTWVLEPDEYKKEDTPDAMDLARLDFEKEAAQRAAGTETQVYGFWGVIWKIWNKYSPEKPAARMVDKKKYLILLVLTGWIGGHRYYEKRWKLGLLYTVFFWTGIPLTMCLIDAMAVIPLQADGEGMITLS